MRDLRISVKNLSKKFITGTPQSFYQRLGAQKGWRRRLFGAPKFNKVPMKELWAVKDLSFNVHHGERVGIIGRNGAGKSTLLKILSRIIPPTEGEARIRGRVTSLLEVGTGFNPNLTGRDNVYVNATSYGLSKAEVDRKFDQIVEFSGVGEFIDMPLKHYSSGMYSRLAFSVAAHLEPDILMLDEVLAVGDIGFQQKCLKKVDAMTSGGQTVIFVSHSLGEVLRFCDRVIWMEQGKIRYDGPATAGVQAYQEFMAPSTNEVALDNRPERRGNGLAQITKIGIYSDKMEPVEAGIAGMDFHIVLDYECQIHRIPEHQRHFNINLVIEDHKAQRLFSMPNYVIKAFTNELLTESGRLVCKIKRLPLMPGLYNLTYTLAVGSENADKLLQSRSFVVLDGDYYGTGMLPPNTCGSICVDYEWNHVKECEYNEETSEKS